MKVVIIDDEPASRKLLKGDIENYCPNIELIGEADGVESGKELIESLKPEAVFLDINMKDGTGFNLIEECNMEGVKVVFVTAFDEFAIKAFRYSAIDYLLKPVSPSQLVETVSRLTQVVSTGELAKRLEALSNNINNAEPSGRILLSAQEGVHIVKVKDIVRCEMDMGCVEFIIEGQEKRIVVAGSLKQFQEMLPENFIRIHTSHIVNIEYVTRYSKEEVGFVVLKGGEQVPVARRRKDFLISALKNSISEA